MQEGSKPSQLNRVEAVLFDVDFTLIYPGPMFMAEGYRAFCERHGMTVDASCFDGAVASAAAILDTPEERRTITSFTSHIPVTSSSRWAGAETARRLCA